MPVRLRSFAPVADRRSRVLVLGSMPGPEALRRRQYYGFPGNRFWPLMAALLGRELPADYPGRLRMLLDARIALWDTVGSCVREGALDAEIRAARPNDVPAFLRRHPGIRAVFLNGRTAEAMYRRHHAARVSLPARYLPSTSPAHAGLPFAAKLAAWRAVLEPLRGSS